MEGDGPSGGDPKFVGVIGASLTRMPLIWRCVTLSHSAVTGSSNY